MKFSRSIFILTILVAGLAATAFAQKPRATDPNATPANLSPLTSSAAYAEIILKRTELQSDLESLVLEYTEEFPKVKEIRYVITLFDRDIERLKKVKADQSSKLTLALGRLIVKRIELETDLWKLQANYKDEHPEVKRAKRRVEIYESAISEILK
jgi:hypothetical protein